MIIEIYWGEYNENTQVDSKTCVNVNEVNIADNAGKIFSHITYPICIRILQNMNLDKNYKKYKT